MSFFKLSAASEDLEAELCKVSPFCNAMSLQCEYRQKPSIAVRTPIDIRTVNKLPSPASDMKPFGEYKNKVMSKDHACQSIFKVFLGFVTRI